MPMGRFISIVTMLSTSIASFAGEVPTVAAIGICIAQHPADPVHPVAFSSLPGTRVALMLTMPSGVILGVDRVASRIERFVDDRGGDLTRCPAPILNESPRLPSTQPGPVPGVITVEVYGPGVPSAGATAVRIGGSLRLRIGTGERKEVIALPALAPGAPLRIGPASLVIQRFAKRNPKATAWTLAIDGVANEDAVLSLRFLDAAGKLIPCDHFQNLSVQEATGHVQHLYSFTGADTPPIASVEATYVGEVKNLDVPLDATATLVPAPMPAFKTPAKEF